MRVLVELVGLLGAVAAVHEIFKGLRGLPGERDREEHEAQTEEREKGVRDHQARLLPEGRVNLKKAKTVTTSTPLSRHTLSTGRIASTPARWPLEERKPRFLAHRLLPSIIMATCRGTDGTEAACGVELDMVNPIRFPSGRFL